MTPSQAGFDGARGISLNHRSMPDGGIFRLRRGETMVDPEKQNLRNQLLWFMPDGEEAKLLYCNDDNQLFELTFIPFTKEQYNATKTQSDS
jgi:hypothetical protein